MGSVLEFAKGIIDKLGEFLCDSGVVFIEEAAAVTPAPDCGVVGQVLNFVKATVDLLLSFIDGAIDYLIALLNEALLDAKPELKSFLTPFEFDIYWVSRCDSLLPTRPSIYRRNPRSSSLIAETYLLFAASLAQSHHIPCSFHPRSPPH